MKCGMKQATEGGEAAWTDCLYTVCTSTSAFAHFGQNVDFTAASMRHSSSLAHISIFKHLLLSLTAQQGLIG